MKSRIFLSSDSTQHVAFLLKLAFLCGGHIACGWGKWLSTHSLLLPMKAGSFSSSSSSSSHFIALACVMEPPPLLSGLVFRMLLWTNHSISFLGQDLLLCGWCLQFCGVTVGSTTMTLSHISFCSNEADSAHLHSLALVPVSLRYT